MTDSLATDYTCTCGACYRVVRTKADADQPHRLVHCLVCKKPLPATEGDSVLKYFLVRSVRE